MSGASLPSAVHVVFISMTFYFISISPKQLQHYVNEKTICTKELSRLQNSPIPNVAISLVSDADLFNWKIILTGPASTPYSGGKFEISFVFPETYPFNAPKIMFVTKIYHPNISQSTGEICNDIIQQDWGPTLNVTHCITELLKVLKNPSADSPLEDEIASQLRDKPKEFEKVAKKWTKEHAQ